MGTLARHIVKGLVLVVGLFLLAYAVTYAVWEATGFARYYRAYVLPIEYEERVPVDGSAPVSVVTTVDTLAFWAPPYPAPGDTVLALASPGRGTAAPESLSRWYAEPDTVLVSFRHGGDDLQSRARVRPPRSDVIGNVIVMEALRFLGVIGLLLIGLWAFLNRPDSAGVRALTLFCFSLAALVLNSVAPLEGSDMPTFVIPWAEVWRLLAVLLLLWFPAFWIHLALLFPRQHPWLGRHPVFGHFAIYGWPALFAVYHACPHGLELARIVMIAMFLQVAIGFTIFGVRFSQASSALEQRQFRLVLTGVGIGLTAILVVFLVLGSWTNLLMRIQPVWRVLLLSLTYLCLVMIPLTFAVAFGRFRLLEVEARIQRSTRYVLVTAVLVCLFVVAENRAVALTQARLPIDSMLPTTALAVLFAVVFAPAHRWFERMMEHRFYPERQRLRELLQGFLASTAALPDLESYWDSLGRLLRDGLGLSEARPLLRWPDGAGWTDGEGNTLPLDANGRAIAALRDETRALMIDEALAADPPLLSAQEAAWLEGEPNAMLLALRHGPELIGALWLVWPRGRERLSAADLKLLVSLADQIALQYAYLRLRAKGA